MRRDWAQKGAGPGAGSGGSIGGGGAGGGPGTDRLAAIPSATGTGTLLDETTIYWFNRHGDGNAHANDALPNVILGGTGGYFKMGRWLQLPKTNPTQVLISLANSMGVNVGTFGESGLSANAPLAGLTG